MDLHALVTFALVALLAAVVHSEFVSDVGTGQSMTCDTPESALTSHVRVTFGATTFYAGYQQVSSNDQNPLVTRFDNGVRSWCVRDYEQTADDGRAYGLLFDSDSNTLYVVFSQTGTLPGPNFGRFTSEGWITGYGSGGGASVSVLLALDGATGAAQRGTYIIAKTTNGRSNSVRVTSLQAVQNLEEASMPYQIAVEADSFFRPLNEDRSTMTCTGGSPFDWQLVFNQDFSTPVRSCAERCQNTVLPDCDPSGLTPARATPMPVASRTASSSISLSRSVTTSVSRTPPPSPVSTPTAMPTTAPSGSASSVVPEPTSTTTQTPTAEISSTQSASQSSQPQQSSGSRTPSRSRDINLPISPAPPSGSRTPSPLSGPSSTSLPSQSVPVAPSGPPPRVTSAAQASTSRAPFVPVPVPSRTAVEMDSSFSSLQQSDDGESSSPASWLRLSLASALVALAL